MLITGTITYIKIAGGFWGIKGDDGRKYCPTSPLPSKYQREGLRIRALVYPSTSMSIFMWGEQVKVSNIEHI